MPSKPDPGEAAPLVGTLFWAVWPALLCLPSQGTPVLMPNPPTLPLGALAPHSLSPDAPPAIASSRTVPPTLDSPFTTRMGMTDLEDVQLEDLMWDPLGLVQSPWTPASVQHSHQLSSSPSVVSGVDWDLEEGLAKSLSPGMWNRDTPAVQTLDGPTLSAQTSLQLQSRAAPCCSGLAVPFAPSCSNLQFPQCPSRVQVLRALLSAPGSGMLPVHVPYLLDVL